MYSDSNWTFPNDYDESSSYCGGSHAYLHTTGHPYPGTINNDIRWDIGEDIYGVIERDTTSSVPEPATMFLLGAGLVGLAGFRKRFLN